MPSPPRDQHLFVVRLWREAGAEDAWRVSVEHVESGQKFATTELRAIEDFIRLRIRNGKDPHVFERRPR
jgi:hypothetical protein